VRHVPVRYRILQLVPDGHHEKKTNTRGQGIQDFFCMKYSTSVRWSIQYISNNERTPNVTKKHGAKALARAEKWRGVCTIHLAYLRSTNPEGETTVQSGQVYPINLYAKRFKKTRKDGVFFVREKKEKKRQNPSRTRRRHQTKV
jgi:hypothetical protein